MFFGNSAQIIKFYVMKNRGENSGFVKLKHLTDRFFGIFRKDNYF